ncbi:MAG TPA: TIGR01906 family membrane protein [Bacillota bacterium]|nr:TIGR01906 family membrane protein [Bacillota bacterium]
MRCAADAKLKPLSMAGNITAGLCALLFFIALGLATVLLFRPFYYFEIDFLNITETSGFSREEIILNYDALIRWCMPWTRTSFSLPTFPSSADAMFHFEQVKSVFRIVWILGLFGGLASLLLLFRGVRCGDKARFRIAGRTVLTVPLLLGLWAAADFNRAFVLFHEWIFRNEYWIFDYRTDPVILILPETFFEHSFILIMLIVAAGAVLLMRLGRKTDL